MIEFSMLLAAGFALGALVVAWLVVPLAVRVVWWENMATLVECLGFWLATRMRGHACGLQAAKEAAETWIAKAVDDRERMLR